MESLKKFMRSIIFFKKKVVKVLIEPKKEKKIFLGWNDLNFKCRCLERGNNSALIQVKYDWKMNP